jgi:hypothetical protein
MYSYWLCAEGPGTISSFPGSGWLDPPKSSPPNYITYPLPNNLTSAPKMEAVCSSETLVFTYKFTWRYCPEDQHQDDESLLQ